MANDSDPFAPARDHAAAIADARTRARADATRHAEDMLDRPLPIVEEAEHRAQGRIALLDAARAERLGELTPAVDEALRAVDSAAEQHTAVLHALVAAGAEDDELALPPLDQETLAAWRIGAPLAVAAVVAAGALLWGLDPIAALVAAAVCAGLAYVAVATGQEQPVEPARLRRLRRSHEAAEAALLSAQSAYGAATKRRESFEVSVRALARAERALAEQMVAVYATELTSAMPPGALADGRAVDTERQPRVDLPDWANEGE